MPSGLPRFCSNSSCGMARHMGMRVCGISCITNMAGGTVSEPLSHEEVAAIANRVAPLFKKIVKSAIEKM